jgi:hypothetical protein
VNGSETRSGPSPTRTGQKRPGNIETTLGHDDDLNSTLPRRKRPKLYCPSDTESDGDDVPIVATFKARVSRKAQSEADDDGDPLDRGTLGGAAQHSTADITRPPVPASRKVQEKAPPAPSVRYDQDRPGAPACRIKAGKKAVSKDRASSEIPDTDLAQPKELKETTKIVETRAKQDSHRRLPPVKGKGPAKRKKPADTEVADEPNFDTTRDVEEHKRPSKRSKTPLVCKDDPHIVKVVKPSHRDPGNDVGRSPELSDEQPKAQVQAKP